MRNLSKLIRPIAYAALSVALLVFPHTSYAATTVGDMFTNLTNSFKTALDLIPILMQIAGLWFGGQCAFALRKMAEERADPDAGKKAIVNGVVGVLLVGLPLVMGVGLQTMFGSTSNNLTSNQGRITVN